MRIEELDSATRERLAKLNPEHAALLQPETVRSVADFRRRREEILQLIKAGRWDDIRAMR